MGPVRPIRHGMEHMIFWKPAQTGYPDGCLVRKRPLTITKEKTKGRRSRDGWFGTWAHTCKKGDLSCRGRTNQEFPEFVLPAFRPKAERELKLRLLCLGALPDAGLVGKEKVVQPVGNGVVEEGWYPEEAF